MALSQRCSRNHNSNNSRKGPRGRGGKLAVGKSVNGFGGDFLRLPVFPFRLLIPAKLADLRIIFHVSHRKGKDE